MAYSPYCAVPSRVRSEPVEVSVPSDSHPVALAVLAVAQFLNVKVNLTSGSQQVKSGDKDGLSATLHHIVSSKCEADQINAYWGHDESTATKVRNWLDVVAKLVSNGPLTVDNAEVKDVNTKLSLLGYCVGGSQTVADFALFGAVHKLIESLNDQQKLELCHITRHSLQIQHILNSRLGFLPDQFPQICVAEPEHQPLKSKHDSTLSKEDRKLEKQKEKDDKKKSKAERQAARGGKAAEEHQQQATTDAPSTSSVADDDKAKLGQVVLRVGHIVKAWAHPEAEKLYVEEIDVGEDKPRTICSGLRDFVEESAMQNRRVVVVCNLKPRNFASISSNGMVLAASNDSHTSVELLDPPKDAVVGERISFAGLGDEFLKEDVLNPKKKIFEAVAEGLKTSQNGVATYKGVPFTTSKGVVTVKTLKNSHIG